MRTIILLLGLLSLISCNSSKSENSSNTTMNSTIQGNNLSVTDNSQLSILSLIENKVTILAERSLKNAGELFTAYTDESGTWKIKTDSVWTSGFVPGYFWYLYSLTENSLYNEWAIKWTEGNRSRAIATDNDTGFQVFNSFGIGYILGFNQSKDYFDTIITGADTLVNQRYNPEIGCFRSWKQSRNEAYSLPFEVNIDQLMNMEIILWAGYNGDKRDYIDFAINHADNTWDNNIRENGSTFHVVDYDLDGSVNLKRTHQGWREDSTWSRGQAWAVYAYIMYYRYTGLERMLERSVKTFDYFIDATNNQTDDYIPYADFDAPIDSMNPRDSSAAAIVASAALELYHITNEERYLNIAEKILLSLSNDDFMSKDSSYDSLLLKGSEKWGRSEVGTIFGDYYFIEALYRWKMWSPRRLPVYFGIN